MLPSLPSLDKEAALESFAIDRPRPTPLAVVDVDTAGDVCREEDGRGAFWEFVGSKEDIEVADCGEREESVKVPDKSRAGKECALY